MKKVRIEKSYSRDGYDIWLAEYQDRRTMLIKPLYFESEFIAEGYFMPQPTFSIPEREALGWARAFLEGLEEVGLADRIREDQGVLNATKDHLKEIQSIADRLLKIVERP